MKRIARMASVLMLAAAALAVQAQDKIGIGSPAPQMSVSKWVKGSPVEQFEKGKVYVVEFWATWCGPCKQSIPHLTEIAKKYEGKATVIGVSVFEEPNAKNEAYFQKVEKFVQEFGPKMEYVVGIDGKEGVMGKTWMEAAGQNGIPAAFIINGEGQIAWIGHPMVGLDETLGKVIDGTYNLQEEKERQAKQAAEEEARFAEVKPFMDLLQQGKHREAVGEMDKAFKKNPNLETQFALTRFEAMTRYDEPGAYQYARTLGNGMFKKAPMMLNQLAWTIVDDQSQLKKRDLKLSIELAQRAVKQLAADDYEQQAYILDTLAYAQYKNKQYADAIKNQEKALAAAKKAQNFDAQTRQDLQDRLTLFKKKGKK